jgi:hypothetical protein
MYTIVGGIGLFLAIYHDGILEIICVSSELLVGSYLDLIGTIGLEEDAFELV